MGAVEIPIDRVVKEMERQFPKELEIAKLTVATDILQERLESLESILNTDSGSSNGSE